MPRVDLVKGENAVVERLVKAVRAVPRTLREDLWTGAAAPLPPGGRPGWLMWQPVVVLLLLICAAVLGVISVNDLAFDWGHGLGTRYALLLGGAQSVALVVAAFRPLPAWWMVTISMVAVAWLSGSQFPRDDVSPWTAPKIAAGLPGSQFPWDPLFPWTGPGIAAQAGVLFMLALRVRPRVVAEALTISLLAGLVCSTLILQGHFTGVAAPSESSPPRRWSAAHCAAVRWLAHGTRRPGGTDREERARRTLMEERNRIARELHDVVAHHMSVISIQAQVAPHLVDNPSDELKENLAGIRENAVGRCPNCAGSWAYCARRNPRRRRPGTPRSPPSTGWTSWSAMCGAPGSGSRSGPPENRAHCRRASSCRRSASCRRRSAT